MRDLVLLHTFLDHLHKNGALSVPPEDLVAAVDSVAERFVIAENGGPGYEQMQYKKAALVEMKQRQRREEHGT
jgi:hypothetical protein